MFLINNCSKPIDSAVFFSKNNIKNFCNYDKCKDTVTHLSEILRSVSLNSIDNFETLFHNKNFSLKQIPEFSDQKSLKSNKGKGEINTIDFEFLKIIYSRHKKFNHSQPGNDNNECRLLFLAMTGLRANSSFELQKNSEFIKRRCSKCSGQNTCTFPTINCLDRLKINQTKTVSHEMPLLTQVQKCFHYLKSSQSNNLSHYQNTMSNFNSFLKESSSSKLTSHGLRKFLPNFSANYNITSNTGNWHGNKNMEKFYLHKEYKYLLLHSHLD